MHIYWQVYKCERTRREREASISYRAIVHFRTESINEATESTKNVSSSFISNSEIRRVIINQTQCITVDTQTLIGPHQRLHFPMRCWVRKPGIGQSGFNCSGRGIPAESATHKARITATTRSEQHMALGQPDSQIYSLFNTELSSKACWREHVHPIW